MPSTPSDSSRTPSGSNYGDQAPESRTGAGRHDPSRGAEMERDSLPPDADFSKPPPLAGTSDPSPTGDDSHEADTARSREDRIRRAAFERYQRRDKSSGDAESDWREAEAEVDAAPGGQASD